MTLLEFPWQPVVASFPSGAWRLDSHDMHARFSACRLYQIHLSPARSRKAIICRKATVCTLAGGFLQSANRMTEKKCPRCLLVFPIAEFQSRKSNYIAVYCRACSCAKSTAWKKANPEYVRANRKYYYSPKSKESSRRYWLKVRDVVLARKREATKLRQSLGIGGRKSNPIPFLDRVKNPTPKQISNAKWQANPLNKVKKQAHRAVAAAISKGIIKKPLACSQCSADCKPKAHHEDYSKPLEVLWLCDSCHMKKHPFRSPRQPKST